MCLELLRNLSEGRVTREGWLKEEEIEYGVSEVVKGGSV